MAGLNLRGQEWRKPIERLMALLDKQGLGVPVEARGHEVTVGGLVALLDTLVEWNARIGLTAARSGDELVDLFLADAAVLAALADRSRCLDWLDVGSGAGAPGLALAWLRPDLRVRFCEPMTKRVAFIRTCAGRMGLGRIDVHVGRSSDLTDGYADCAVSRATFSPDQWLAEGARLARQQVWVLLARLEAPVYPGWQQHRCTSYEWPLTAVSRRVIAYGRSPG